LSHAAPDRLDILRTRFPRDAVQLRPGGILGDSSPNIGCAVALDALAVYGPAAANLRAKLKSRLAWSWRFDLFAKFAAACGSGGAVGVLVTGVVAVDKAIVASAVALFGSLCGLLFSYLQRDETAGSVTDAYNKLIVSLVELDQLQRSLPPLCAATDSPELRAALASANNTAKTLNELVLRFG
jgi:hypothetical protein